MKSLYNIKGGFIAFALIALFASMFTSCRENDEGGQPVITGVRICDPEAADSLFNKSPQGQTIAIIGENLSNIVKITINGQNVGFSPTMNTDHSVIITVPSEANGFLLGAFVPDLVEEIYIETTHGSCTYPFQVATSSPYITRIQCEYPRKAGDKLKVVGKNLVSIDKIYFTDILAATLDTTKWDEIGGNIVEPQDYEIKLMKHYLDNKTQSYTTDSELEVTIPELPYDAGTFVIECAAGTTYISYTKLPGKPIIKSISTDMPVIGEDLIIRGNDFVQVEYVSIGDVTYTPDEFIVAESEDEIIIPITKVPNMGTGTTLILKTAGGEAAVEHFFDYSTLLVNFDEVPAGDLGWSPNALFEIATPDAVPCASSGTYARISVESETAPQWWGTMLFYHGEWVGENQYVPFTLPDFDVIPADAPASDIYLAMEVYNNNSDYNNDGSGFSGFLRYVLFPNGADTGAEDQTQWTFDNFSWTDYNAGLWANTYPVLGDINDDAPTGKWYRHVLSLRNFPVFSGLTYADIKNIGIENIRIQSINQGTKPGKIDFCLDNIRIIYIKK